jgi:two-component sensor histidine kinase
MKYGALRDGKRVRIEGKAGDGLMEVTWCEETHFGAARRGGQGLDLIERLIRSAGGTLKREVEATQMRATITMPII